LFSSIALRILLRTNDDAVSDISPKFNVVLSSKTKVSPKPTFHFFEAPQRMPGDIFSDARIFLPRKKKAVSLDRRQGGNELQRHRIIQLQGFLGTARGYVSDHNTQHDS
jgi:hypothetical protein